MNQIRLAWARASEPVSAPLCGAERAAAVTMSPGRRADFRTGRALARRCLVTVGFPPTGLSILDSGAPGWPAGVWGSISHTDGAAVAIATTQNVRVGIDVERHADVPWEAVYRVSRPGELAEAVDAVPALLSAAVLWSAKEAAVKATGSRPMAVRIEQIRSESAFHGRFEIRADAGGSGRGRWWCGVNHITSLVVLDRQRGDER